MSMNDEINNQLAPTDIEEENPLLFWVAYMVGTDGKMRYMGDGKNKERQEGEPNVRFFKRRYGEGGIEEFLDQNVKDPEKRARVHVHATQGKILVPISEEDLKVMQAADRPAPLPPVPNVLDRLPINIPQIPISTLDRTTLPPNAIDLLDEEIKRKKKRRRR
jgi:hypothetical protein